MLVLGQSILAAANEPTNDFFDAATVAAAVSFFIPLAVSFFTKKDASTAVRAVANVLGTAVAAVVTVVNDGKVEVNFRTLASAFVASLITSIAAYHAVWKPLKISPAIEAATKNFGVGGRDTREGDAEVNR